MVYEECSVGEVVRRVYPDLHCGGGGGGRGVGRRSVSWCGSGWRRRSTATTTTTSSKAGVATPPPPPSSSCSINTLVTWSSLHPSTYFHRLPLNTMTIVSEQNPNVVCVAVGERGVVGSGCLLSAMSGVEAQPEAAPSPPPSSPHPAHHHTAHDDDDDELPVTSAAANTNTAVVSSSSPSTTGVGSESLPQVVVRSRRKLENEDSSYDSDFEPCEWAPASPRPEDDDQHDDVCRTVSDTLGAEFAEYVTIKHGNPNPTPTPISTLSSSLITRIDTSISTSSSSLTTQVITSSNNNNNNSSSSSNLAVVTTPATTSTTAISSLDPKSISSPSVITTSTNITTPTSVTTTTTTTVTTVSTTSVSSSASSAESKAAHESSVRATSPAVRLPSSSPPPATSPSVGGPPSLSVTPPAPVPSTVTPSVTVTQAPPAFSIPSISSTSSCSISSSSISSTTPAVTITSEVTSSATSSSSSSPALASSSSSSSEVPSGVSWVVQHSGYASQVEFGVKLGYSESLVQQALIKLGGIPDKDELLAELIRLGTSTGRPDGEGDAADDLVDIKEDTEQQQQQQHQQQSTLKPIIIDGSNVAMRHGNKKVFSCRGLRICVDWFRDRGHNEITVFVPTWRKEAPRWDTPITDQEILLELEQENVLVFTPSRVCGGKRIVSYDDRYILKEAVETGGIVVSNDNYRDLAAESPAFRKVIEESLLMYSWVNGRFVPPDDPLGRNGPTLDAFLRKTPKDRQAPCPYGRKCTYGNKCKYMHPERGAAPLKSVTERLQEQAQRHFQKKANSRDSSPGEGLRGKSLSLPLGVADPDVAKKPLQRTQSNVPSVSLTLPSALTQETPTHDLGPNTATSTASHTHRHLMPPQMEPPHQLETLRSSQMFKSESSLYHLYPSQGPQASYGSSTWGWESQGTMPNPQGGAPHSQPQNYGAHMPLTKNLSDPDSLSSENPHKKLQRQLTLNPAYDSRLYKIVGFKEPAPELFPLAHQQQQQQAVGQVSPSRTVKRDSENLVYSQVTGAMTGRHSPGYSSQFGSREQLATALHQPLTRHSSSQEGAKHMTSLPSHLYPPYSHPHVTRFASAPDPIWGGGHQQQTTTGPPHITRLNSTSDTRLNSYGCGSEPQFISEVYDDQMARLPPFHSAAAHHSASPVPAAPSPGPIGSRPMSPQQSAVLHRSGVQSRQHKPSQQHLPSQQTPSFPNPITGAASHEDARLRVYYHLSNLFPEAQVRAALAMYPEETDPHKICTSIFSINPGPVGSRPMSPQQPTQSAVSHQAQNVPVRGSSPLTAGFPNPLPTAASSHEDARFRAFYHLSQLFPVDQVRAVLARFPDETDAQTLCAALIGLSGNQS